MPRAKAPSTKKTALKKYGITESFSVLQVRNIMDERGISVEALSGALGQPITTTRKWLNGSNLPSVAVLEACCRLLAVVPIFVSIDEQRTGAGLRDYLSPEDQGVYDSLDSDPKSILLNQLRDLGLQRVIVERDYNCGLLEDDEHRKCIFDIMEISRRLCDSLAKLTLAGGKGNISGAVETIYGSPKGPGYNEADVARVNENQPTETPLTIEATPAPALGDEEEASC